jgi:hypothetical protein
MLEKLNCFSSGSDILLSYALVCLSKVTFKIHISLVSKQSYTHKTRVARTDVVICIFVGWWVDDNQILSAIFPATTSRKNPKMDPFSRFNIPEKKYVVPVYCRPPKTSHAMLGNIFKISIENIVNV